MLDLDVGFLSDPRRLLEGTKPRFDVYVQVSDVSDDTSQQPTVTVFPLNPMQKDIAYVMNRTREGWRTWYTVPLPNIGTFSYSTVCQCMLLHRGSGLFRYYVRTSEPEISSYVCRCLVGIQGTYYLVLYKGGTTEFTRYSQCRSDHLESGHQTKSRQRSKQSRGCYESWRVRSLPHELSYVDVINQC